MSDIFISYSRDDKPWVSKLAKALQEEGYSVWWDPEIMPGQDFEQVIQEALENTKCVLTIWSPSSVKSQWVRSETSKALELNKLIPIQYLESKLPMPFDRIHTADLQGWKGKTDDHRYQRLLGAIQTYTDKKPPIDFPQKKPKRKIWLFSFGLILLLSMGAYYFWQTNHQVKTTSITKVKLGSINMALP